jgi:hypothetical protein
MRNCRECGCCIYTLEPRELQGPHHHVLRCHDNRVVERFAGFPQILAEQPASCGPLPDVVKSKPEIGCPINERSTS